MAQWSNTGVAVTWIKSAGTSYQNPNGYTPPSAGGWVVIFVCADATMPVSPTMTSSADTTNPVRLVGSTRSISSNNNVAIAVFMHKAASTELRGYTVDFGGNSVVAKSLHVVGYITGSDVPDDSATITDFCDVNTGSSSAGTPSAGYLSSPPVRPMVLGFACAAVEAASGDSMSWGITESQTGAVSSTSASSGTSGGGNTSNVSGGYLYSDTSTGGPDATGDFWVHPVTFGSSNCSCVVAIRLLEQGTPTLTPTGIASAGSVGQPTLIYNQTVSPTGISTAQAIGSPTVASQQQVSLTGISSAQAMGSVTATPGSTTVLLSGIAAGAIGNPTIQPGSVTVSLSGIGSAESLGDVGVFSGFITMSPTGIGSTGAVGDIRITVPPVNVFLGDIQFDSQLGSPTVGVLTTIATPPTRAPYPVAENSRLFLREFLTEGVTFYRVGTEWFSGNDLPEDLEADELYRGGYEYLVTTAKGAELEALGFTIRTEIR